MSHRPALADIFLLLQTLCQLSEAEEQQLFHSSSSSHCAVSLFPPLFSKRRSRPSPLSSRPPPLPPPTPSPNSWLAVSLISNRTRRIGSGLKVWHCHSVGGDETALCPTLLHSTWLILGGRCYSACCTSHPPPRDRHWNYSQGEQSACKLISVSPHFRK